ncbi:hypothetical protein ABT246_40850 [Streptomyces sp. NPDC001553]|uniref:hypothetical protein n=1 Tax=Streptomyces sp. NPDC001553 TaxID=3154385 RepID=UPI00331E5B0E
MSVSRRWRSAPGSPPASSLEPRLRAWSWRGWLLLYTSQQTDRPALRVPLIARTIRSRELTARGSAADNPDAMRVHGGDGQ